MDNDKYILIVDDNEFFPKLIQGELEKKGFVVEVVSDGETALSRISQKAPSLLLLDLIMPKMDGFEVLEELNKMGVEKDINILVFSNLSQDEDIKRVKELGANDYIVKQDLSFESVMEKIENYLK